MDPRLATHPTPEQLSAFRLGKFPEAEADRVAGHLETCEACRRAVDQCRPIRSSGWCGPRGKRQLIVPPELGYGKAGFLTIPPNSKLHFKIELLRVLP